MLGVKTFLENVARVNLKQDDPFDTPFFESCMTVSRQLESGTEGKWVSWVTLKEAEGEQVASAFVVGAHCAPTRTRLDPSPRL